MSRIFNVTINFKTGGADASSKTISSISQSAATASKSILNLQNALAALGAYKLLSSMSDVADEILNVRNRLGFVASGAEEAGAIFYQLLKVSDQTRTSFENTAEVFARFSLVTREMGTSQKEVLDIVGSINQAVILSGANAREAQASLIQLSHAVASDRLNGRELRSVLQQLPYVADIIGKQLGVTRGALRFLAQEGKINAETILDAFKNSATEIAAAFANTVPTIEQSFVLLRNAVIRFTEDLDKRFNVFSRVSDLITYIAKNIDTFARLALIGVTIGAIVIVITALTVAVGALLDPFALLIPVIGIFATVLGGIFATFVAYSDRIQLPFLTDLGKFFGILKDGETVTLLDLLLAIVDKFIDVLKEILADIQVAIPNALQILIGTGENIGKAVSAIAGFIDPIIRNVTAAVYAIGSSFTEIYNLAQFTFSNLGTILKAAFKIDWNLLLTGLETVLDTIVAAFVTTFTALGTTIAQNAAAILDSVLNGTDYNFSFVDRFTDNLRTQFRTVKNALSDLDVFGFLKVDLSLNESLTLLRFSGMLDNMVKLVKEKFTGASSAIGSPVTDFLNKVLGGTLTNAQNRNSAEHQINARSDVNLTGDRKGSGLKSLRTVVFEEETKKLQAEAGAISATNSEREISVELAKTLLGLESKDFSNPTSSETNQIRALIQSKTVYADVTHALDSFQKQLQDTPGHFDIVNAKVSESTLLANNLINQAKNGILTTREVTEAIDKYTQNLAALATVYHEIYSPAADYVRTMSAIATVSQTVTNDTDKQRLVMLANKAVIAKFADDPTPFAGLQRGMASLDNEIINIGALYETTFTNAFKGAEDALVQFTSTGAANFRTFATSVLADMERIALRQFILGPLEQAAGSAFGSLFSQATPGLGEGSSQNLLTGQYSLPEGQAFVNTGLVPVSGDLSGRAVGGPVIAGHPYMVGENGPEPFVPATNGTIIPHGAMGQNVTVNINVSGVTNPNDFRKTQGQMAREAASAIRRLSN